MCYELKLHADGVQLGFAPDAEWKDRKEEPLRFALGPVKFDWFLDVQLWMDENHFAPWLTPQRFLAFTTKSTLMLGGFFFAKWTSQPSTNTSWLNMCVCVSPSKQRR